MLGEPDVSDLIEHLVAPIRIVRKLDAEIDAESDDKSTLTHEQREKAEAEVMGDLLDIERQEAALTWQAQGIGHPANLPWLAL